MAVGGLRSPPPRRLRVRGYGRRRHECLAQRHDDELQEPPSSATSAAVRGEAPAVLTMVCDLVPYI